MKKSALTALLAAAILAACGGGGGSGEATVSPVATLAPLPPTSPPREILYGYYASCDSCNAEMARHVNLIHVPNWSDLNTTIRYLSEARTYGVKNILLGVPQLYHAPDPEAVLRAFFTTLRGANALTNISALYPQDEPDLKKIPAETVIAKNALLRRVMAEFPELAATRLAVIYTNFRQWPGIESYDWVGFDDYPAGEKVFAAGGLYEALKARLRPDQRILLVPGGADPWQQDPAEFFAKAIEDPQVVAVLPFIWYDFADKDVGKGIRSNGMARVYCEGARTLTKSPTATC